MWLGLEEGVELGLGGEETAARVGEEVIPTHRHRWKEIIHLSIIQFIALIFHSNNVFIVHRVHLHNITNKFAEKKLFQDPRW
jgi:hypothetical protein